MISRLFLIRYWAFLFTFGLLFASCGSKVDNAVILGDELMSILEHIRECISGKSIAVDGNSNPVGEASCPKDFSKASELFLDLKNNLAKSQADTGNPIATNLLTQISTELSYIQGDIAAISNSSYKELLKERCDDLVQYIHFLGGQKGVPQVSTTCPSPAG